MTLAAGGTAGAVAPDAEDVAADGSGVDDEAVVADT